MRIFYHGDADGIAAAATYINKMNNNSTVDLTVIEFQYDKQDVITKGKHYKGDEEIIFLDCCPNKEVLQYILSKSNKITIIDHHKTTKDLIDAYINEGLISGMSYIGASATLITWCWWTFNKDVEKICMFLDKAQKNRNFQDENIPKAIKLINSWDIWNGLYIDAEPFKTYYEAQNFLPIDKQAYILLWNEVEVNKAIQYGNYMIEFFHSWGNEYCRRYSYEVSYKDKTFLILNIGNANSKVFRRPY